MILELSKAMLISFIWVVYLHIKNRKKKQKNKPMDAMQAYFKKWMRETLIEALPDIQNALSKEMLKNAPQKSDSKTEFITRTQAAKLLGISLVTLDKWAYKQGIIPFLRISSRVRLRRSDVEACLSKVKVWKHSREGGEDRV